MGLHQHRFSWEGSDDQSATFLSLGANGHRVFDASHVAAGLALRANVGKITAGAFAGQRETFWSLGLGAHAWKPLRLPLLSGEQKLALRFSGQLSGSQLPSTLRMSLGGANRARGFERDVFLADQGVVLGVDVRFGLPLGELVLFADAAYGESLNSAAEEWGHVANFGIGWDADLRSNLITRLSLALPVSARGSVGLDDDGAQIFWSLRYEH